MTTWAHLTELFSSLPWFKIRDPRGVARKFTALRAARRRASLHIKILSLSTCFFGHGSASSFVYMFSLCAAIAAVSVRAGEAARSAAAAAPSTSTHARRARALLVERSPVLLSFEISYVS